MKYDTAACISACELPHDCRQEITLLVNSDDGQKQLASLLDVQLGTSVSQVLMHFGRRSGFEGTVEVAGADPVTWGLLEGMDSVDVEVRVIVETVL